MDMWDLKKWRRKLRYSQFEAAEKFGVSRGALQKWESERRRVPYAVKLASEEIARLWKQRLQFGPVILMYVDESIWPEPDYPSRVLCVQCELQPNNETMIQRALRLREGPGFVNAIVLDIDGELLWTNVELSYECDLRLRAAKDEQTA